MSEIIQSRKKMREVTSLLSEVKTRLKELGKERKETQYQPEALKPIVRNEKIRIKDSRPVDFKEAYEELYNAFITRDFDGVRDFIKSKDRPYLKELCKANSLSVDGGRASRDKVIEEVFRLMAQRRAVTKRLT